MKNDDRAGWYGSPTRPVRVATGRLGPLLGIPPGADPKFAPMAFKGQVGKVRDWLAERSKTVKAMIETIKAEEAQNLPEVDADALLEEAKGA